MPSKHVPFSASLLAIAGLARQKLTDGPLTLDELWYKVSKTNHNSLIKPSFTQLILAIDLLYSIKQIKLNDLQQIQLISTKKIH